MSRITVSRPRSQRGPRAFARLASLSLATVIVLAGTALRADEYSAQWGLVMTGARIAHERGYIGRGVNVGVVDSGIIAGHADLDPNLSGLSLNGYTLGATGTDAVGHGTHVAGTIAATANGTGMMGVSPGARVTSLQIARHDGSIDETLLDGAVAAVIGYGLDNGIEFFNNSWGTDTMMPEAGPGLDIARAHFETGNPQMLASFRRAAAQGAVMVWANGNDGFAGAAYEAALPHLFPELRGNWLAVAAVGRDGGLTDYSNRCGLAMAWCLSAPGGDDDETAGGIHSTANTGGYVNMSGTSMAAPHVTGALAIAREMFPNASASDLARLVLATSRDVGAAGIDAEFGWGILDLAGLTATRDAGTASVLSLSRDAQAATLGQIAGTIAELAASRGSGTTTGGISLSTHGGAPASEARLRFWAASLAGFSSTSASATSSGGIARDGGLLSGIDVSLAEGVGAGIGIGFSAGSSQGGGNSARSTGLHAVAYGSYASGGVFGDLAGGISRFEVDRTRNAIAGAGGAGGFVGKSSAVDIGAWSNARIGMTFDTVGATLQPYLQSRLVHQSLGGSRETGAGVFALSASSTASSQFDAGAGLRLSASPLALGAYALTPVADIAYARAIGALGDTREATMLGAPVAGGSTGIGRDIARLSAGLELASDGGRLSGSLNYSGEYRARARSHALAASLSLRF
jgi:hypothetical protein